MCISPHEMTSTRIEKEIEMMERWLNEDRDKFSQNFYRRRIEMLQGLLKERAENGTYHNDAGRR